MSRILRTKCATSTSVSGATGSVIRRSAAERRAAVVFGTGTSGSLLRDKSRSGLGWSNLLRRRSDDGRTFTRRTGGEGARALQFLQLGDFGRRDAGRRQFGAGGPMARFLSCHKSKNESPVEEAETRARVLAQWCETIWKIVAVYDGKGEPRH